MNNCLIRFGRTLHRKSCSHWVPDSERSWLCPVTTSLTIIASSKLFNHRRLLFNHHCRFHRFSLFFVVVSFKYLYINSDALVTSSINLGTSLLAGFVIFAGLGYIAHTRGIKVDQLGLAGLFLHYLSSTSSSILVPVDHNRPRNRSNSISATRCLPMFHAPIQFRRLQNHFHVLDFIFDHNKLKTG